MESYSPGSIEKKWQKVWQEKGLYRAEDWPLSACRQPSSESAFSSLTSEFTEEGDRKGDKRKEVGGRKADSGIKPKFYALVEFPYPSGAGLHVGHVRAWSGLDAYVRKKRMEGYNVLFPMGWDAFGLPAENYAIKKGVHPSVTTAENIANFKRQIQALGLSFDWSREINTTDPRYYKWTQWIFLKLLEHDLAYQKEVPVNWCPACRTNLADEEVLPNGSHERCGQSTEKRLQKQWLLRITKYADRLIEDLKSVDFPSKVAVQQVNWIGRKEGINITYDLIGLEDKITVFTTTPVNFGATFLVVAPEHPVVERILGFHNRHPELATAKRGPVAAVISGSTPSVMPDRDLASRPTSLDSGSPSGMTVAMDKTRLEEIRKYVEQAKSKSEAERVAEGREKTGVFTGLYAVNHVTGKNIPIWISDFVLSNVGTGAVQGCPGHDKRDWDFAKKFGLPIVRVVSNPEGTDPDISDEPFIVHVGDSGVMVNSDFLNGVDFSEAMSKTMDYFAEKGWGKRNVTYHLHDWIFSRQHYWGEPIPVVYCAACAKTTEISNLKSQISNINGTDYAVVPVAEKDLPVELPFVEKYEPSGTGESPLANMADWVNVICPKCGGPARRETDTMPNWAGSNWYYLAYLFANKLGNPNADSRHAEFISASQSGSEIPKQVRDDRSNDIFSQNKYLIDSWMPVDVYEGGYEHTTLHLLYSRFIYKFLFDIGVVPSPEPYAARRVHGIVLGPDNRKMSKSFGNVLNPDEIIEKFGADTLRMYEMFIGPFAETVTWNMNGVAGVYRFLGRIYLLFERSLLENKTSLEKIPDLTDKDPGSGQTGQLLSKLAKKVSSDLDALKFNTAVSGLMEFVNEISNPCLAGRQVKFQISNPDWDIFLRVLAPMAPHLAEELYQRLHSNVILSDSLRHSDPAQPEKDLNSRDSSGRTPQNDESFVSVHEQPWPDLKIEEAEQDVSIVVQINGKVREVLKMSNVKCQMSNEVEKLALESEKVKKHLENHTYKVIFVPGRLINFVMG